MIPREIPKKIRPSELRTNRMVAVSASVSPSPCGECRDERGLNCLTLTTDRLTNQNYWNSAPWNHLAVAGAGPADNAAKRADDRATGADDRASLADDRVARADDRVGFADAAAVLANDAASFAGDWAAAANNAAIFADDPVKFANPADRFADGRAKVAAEPVLFAASRPGSRDHQIHFSTP